MDLVLEDQDLASHSEVNRRWNMTISREIVETAASEEEVETLTKLVEIATLIVAAVIRTGAVVIKIEDVTLTEVVTLIEGVTLTVGGTMIEGIEAGLHMILIEAALETRIGHVMTDHVVMIRTADQEIVITPMKIKNPLQPHSKMEVRMNAKPNVHAGRMILNQCRQQALMMLVRNWLRIPPLK